MSTIATKKKKSKKPAATSPAMKELVEEFDLMAAEHAVLSSAETYGDFHEQSLLSVVVLGLSANASSEPFEFATEALTKIGADLEVLQLAMVNRESPLGDDEVNAAIYRLAMRARCASEVACRIHSAKSVKNGGAK